MTAYRITISLLALAVPAFMFIVSEPETATKQVKSTKSSTTATNSDDSAQFKGISTK